MAILRSTRSQRCCEPVCVQVVSDAPMYMVLFCASHMLLKTCVLQARSQQASTHKCLARESGISTEAGNGPTPEPNVSLIWLVTDALLSKCHAVMRGLEG